MIPASTRTSPEARSTSSDPVEPVQRQQRAVGQDRVGERVTGAGDPDGPSGGAGGADRPRELAPVPRPFECRGSARLIAGEVRPGGHGSITLCGWRRPLPVALGSAARAGGNEEERDVAEPQDRPARARRVRSRRRSAGAGRPGLGYKAKIRETSYGIPHIKADELRLGRLRRRLRVREAEHLHVREQQRHDVGPSLEVLRPRRRPRRRAPPARSTTSTPTSSGSR